MKNKIIMFPQNNSDYFEQIKKYKFGLYALKMVYEDGTLKHHLFIALKHRNTNVVLELTPYSKFLRYTRRNKSIDFRRFETLRVRGVFICLFLNYVLIDKYTEFGLTNLKDITIEHGNRFLQDYVNGEITKGRKNRKTIKKIIIEIAKFYSWIQIVYGKEAQHLHGIQMLEEVEVENRKSTHRQVSYNTPFQIHVSEKLSEPVFRDIPNKVFWVLLKISKVYYPEITIGLCLEAFAGLRIGEVCNVRQDICPLDGGGFSYRKVKGKLTRFNINLKNKFPMRSDDIDVGSIKKFRDQYVYPKFLPYFEPIFKEHMEWLKTQEIENGYYPLIVDSNGKAMTAQNYRKKFKRLVHEHLVEVLIDSDDTELQIYGELLMQKQLSPHALRHWFTVHLVLENVQPHAIADWRGDNNLETALLYVKNKSELLELYKKANGVLIDEINGFNY